jgi:hypothetical protein
MGRVSQETSNVTPEGKQDKEMLRSDNIQGMASVGQPSNGPLVSDTMLNSDPIGLTSSLELERSPALNGTMTEIYEDELYTPSFQFIAALPGQTATTPTSLPTQSDILSQTSSAGR